MTIDPRGVIVQIKYFRDLRDYKYFSELKSVKIELEIINEFGQKVKKTYKDTIEVMKKGDDVGFRAKFDEGKVRDSEYINYTFEKSNSNPPFATNPYTKSKVIDRYLKEGDEFFVVEYKGANAPGGFWSKEPIFTIDELRNKLAVIEDWKNTNIDELVIRKYKVLQEIPVRDGYIGPMLETTKGSKNFGKTYKGGGHQYETLQRFIRDDVYTPSIDASNIGKSIEKIEDFVKTLK